MCKNMSHSEGGTLKPAAATRIRAHMRTKSMHTRTLNLLSSLAGDQPEGSVCT